MTILAKLSLGYFADRVSYAIGWSPLAKSVAIFGAEGPFASLFEGVVGTVQSVERGTMTLVTDRAVHSTPSESSLLVLTPRHAGWTPRAMCFRPIAVVVEILRPDGQRGPVAIAMATVIRKRGRQLRL